MEKFQAMLIKKYDGMIIIPTLNISWYDVSTLVTWKYNRIKRTITIGKL